MTNQLREGIASLLELSYFTPTASRELSAAVIAGGDAGELAELARKSSDPQIVEELIKSRYATVRAAICENQITSIA